MNLLPAAEIMDLPPDGTYTQRCRTFICEMATPARVYFLAVGIMGTVGFKLFVAGETHHEPIVAEVKGSIFLVALICLRTGCYCFWNSPSKNFEVLRD